VGKSEIRGERDGISALKREKGYPIVSRARAMSESESDERGGRASVAGCHNRVAPSEPLCDARAAERFFDPRGSEPQEQAK